MAQTVIGFFDNETEARQAVQQLMSSGFSHDNVDLSSSGRTGTTGTSTTSYNSDNDDDSISGFFRSLFGGDNDDAKTYSNVARNTGCMVTVHAQSSEEADRAADILDDNGAVDVDERASQYGYAGNTAGTTGYTGATGMDTTDTAYTGATTGTTGYTGTTDVGTTNNLDSNINTTEGNTSIPIIEENLQVGKRVVERGGARLRSRIIERPVEETLRLRHERVHIERNPVNRPVSDADLANFREGEIELTEREEVPVVNKEARVVEEVTLGKEVEEHEETIRDTVRSTEVDVERLNTTDSDQVTGTDRTRFNETDDRDRLPNQY